VKGPKAVTDHKAAGAGVDRQHYLIVILYLVFMSSIYSQEQPQDELQVDLNSYFDNFNVDVLFPSVSINKNVSKSTTVTARYMTDIISAASMRSTFIVDGVTSATTKHVGGGDDKPDEWRHQFGGGIIQNILDGTASFNGSYSREHDYSSKTFILNLSYPFAKKNTILQYGYTANWDLVFPQVDYWTRQRNTYTSDFSLTQILAKNLLAQLIFSYSTIRGYQTNGYQVVKIIENDTVHTLNVIHPDFRARRTAGILTNWGFTKSSTLELDYRYYWDNWKIFSNTISGSFKSHLSDLLNLELEYRQYYQTRAFFFKPVYTQLEKYMAVESSLNSGYSNQILLTLTFSGHKKYRFPLLNSDKMQIITSIGFYHRHTDTPDWHSLYTELYAYLFNLGFRIKL
jgi:hypothetical protein